MIAIFSQRLSKNRFVSRTPKLFTAHKRQTALTITRLLMSIERLNRFVTSPGAAVRSHQSQSHHDSHLAGLTVRDDLSLLDLDMLSEDSEIALEEGLAELTTYTGNRAYELRRTGQSSHDWTDYFNETMKLDIDASFLSKLTIGDLAISGQAFDEISLIFKNCCVAVFAAVEEHSIFFERATGAFRIGLLPIGWVGAFPEGQMLCLT